MEPNSEILEDVTYPTNTCFIHTIYFNQVLLIHSALLSTVNLSTIQINELACALIVSVCWEKKLWWGSLLLTLEVGRKIENRQLFSAFLRHQVESHPI